MSLTVLNPGLASRIVDLGRPRSRNLGVPFGGAADRRSFAIGSSLVGNTPEAPALEITLKGPHLRADTAVGCVLFGAPFETKLSGRLLSPYVTFTLNAGDELRIGGASKGARAYLCVRGGFHVPSILGSRSALETIRPGDVLPCDASTIGAHSSPELEPAFPDVAVIAAVPGLQTTWFDEREFFDQTFVVTPDSNRMGLRLKSNALTMPKREMVSEPVCPGAVQITPDGQSIVLGMDGQTIGGYPKIAQIIQADLDTLGQLRPGQRLRFVKIGLDEATARDRAAQADLRQRVLRLRLSLDAFPAERKFVSS